MTDEEILTAAERAYADGMQPITGTWRIGVGDVGCEINRGCLLHAATGCTSQSEASERTGRSEVWVAGVLCAWDGKSDKYTTNSPDFVAGFAFGAAARKRFIGR